jgi:hypothetical protein
MTTQFRFRKGDLVRHPKESLNWGIGTVLEDSTSVDVSVFFENGGRRNLQLSIIDLIKVLEPNLEIALKLRIYLNEPFQDIYDDLKSKLPGHLVIIENGTYFEVLNDDAVLCQKNYGWKIFSRTKNQNLTGFPITQSFQFQRLTKDGLSYVIVCQIEHGTPEAIPRRVKRVVNC